MASTLKEIGDKLSEFVDKVKGALQDEAMRQLIAEDLGLPPSGRSRRPICRRTNSTASRPIAARQILTRKPSFSC